MSNGIHPNLLSLVYALLNEHYSIVYLDRIAMFKKCCIIEIALGTELIQVLTCIYICSVYVVVLLMELEWNSTLNPIVWLQHAMKSSNCHTLISTFESSKLWNMAIPLVFMKHQWTTSPCKYRQTYTESPCNCGAPFQPNHCISYQWYWEGWNWRFM